MPAVVPHPAVLHPAVLPPPATHPALLHPTILHAAVAHPVHQAVIHAVHPAMVQASIVYSVPPPITEDLIFYLVAALIIGMALVVVLIRNVIHAALALGTCFIGVAGLYVLLHAQFLAVAQVLVYVGDVTVLFLFAVMLT
nr:NADH-quinone oxidoreductase subunit J [Armatimonadota bacterium]